MLCLVLALALANSVHVPNDKTQHVFAGIFIASTLNWRYGCAAGLAKEAYDSTGRGTVEALDLVATCMGAVIGEGVVVREGMIAWEWKF